MNDRNWCVISREFSPNNCTLFLIKLEIGLHAFVSVQFQHYTLQFRQIYGLKISTFMTDLCNPSCPADKENESVEKINVGTKSYPRFLTFNQMLEIIFDLVGRYRCWKLPLPYFNRQVFFQILSTTVFWISCFCFFPFSPHPNPFLSNWGTNSNPHFLTINFFTKVDDFFLPFKNFRLVVKLILKLKYRAVCSVFWGIGSPVLSEKQISRKNQNMYLYFYYHPIYDSSPHLVGLSALWAYS